MKSIPTKNYETSLKWPKNISATVNPKAILGNSPPSQISCCATNDVTFLSGNKVLCEFKSKNILLKDDADLAVAAPVYFFSWAKIYWVGSRIILVGHSLLCSSKLLQYY